MQAELKSLNQTAETDHALQPPSEELYQTDPQANKNRPQLLTDVPNFWCGFVEIDLITSHMSSDMAREWMHCSAACCVLCVSKISDALYCPHNFC